MNILSQPAPQTLAEAMQQIEVWKALALTDDLTGLYHRRAGDRVVQELRQSAQQFIIFMIDLNEFKPINDQAGHETGDKVLKAMAEALRGAADTVCRWGGDEFLVISKCRKADASAIAHRIKASLLFVDLDKFLPAGMAEHRCGAAIGWADCSEAQSLDELLNIADERMYQDKGAHQR